MELNTQIMRKIDRLLIASMLGGVILLIIWGIGQLMANPVIGPIVLILCFILLVYLVYNNIEE